LNEVFFWNQLKIFKTLFIDSINAC